MILNSHLIFCLYCGDQLYRPVGETPCHFVSSLDELVELNEKLLKCQEFAVDLEVTCT